jgi:hypothetical protein
MSGVTARRLLVVGAAVAVVIQLVVVSVVAMSVVPRPRAALSLRDAIPMHQVIRNADRESPWPEVWVDAVCDRPVYPVRRSDHLSHATRLATCASRVKLGGDVDYLMLAYYPDDLPMQADLRDRGFTYYWSGSRWGKPFVVATVSETTVIGRAGLPVASSLRPLEQFGQDVQRVPRDP